MRVFGRVYEDHPFQTALEQWLAGVGDADDLNVSTLKVVLQKPFDVPVNESDDGEAEWRLGGLGKRNVRHDQKSYEYDAKSR